jgi:hypothetical protein
MMELVLIPPGAKRRSAAHPRASGVKRLTPPSLFAVPADRSEWHDPNGSGGEMK